MVTTGALAACSSNSNEKQNNTPTQTNANNNNSSNNGSNSNNSNDAAIGDADPFGKYETPLTIHFTRDVDNDTQDRSEEHTSELQSRENLVCRLLLEKKKNKTQKK